MAPATTYNFTSAEREYQLSHRNETRASMIQGVIGTFTALATISVLMRVWVRKLNKDRFEADDYTIFIALIFTWGAFIAFYYRTLNGDGWHFLAITPEMFHRLLIAFFVFDICFPMGQMFTQISFLLLYKRIFTLHRKWFRITMGVVALLALTSNLATVLGILFGCSPLKKAWERTIKGRCINTVALFVANTALALVVDTAIIIAPLPLVWSLNTSRRTKLAVIGMVLLGCLVSIVNPVKLHNLTIPSKGDVTYNGELTNILVHVQLCLGVIAASLLCYRPLFHGFRGVFSSQHPSATAPTSGNIRSGRSAKESVHDQYKTSEGKEPSLTESDIGLVPLQQKWITARTFPGQSSSGDTKSVAEGGLPRSKDDAERNFSLNEITVTRDVDVISSHAD